MKIQGRLLKIGKAAAAIFLVAVSCVSVGARLPEFFGSERQAALAAASFTLTDGTLRAERQSSNPAAATPPEAVQTAATQPVTEAPATQPSTAAQPKQRDKSDYYDSYADHSGEGVGTVEERFFGSDGDLVDSCYVKNATGVDFDFASYLNAPLTFSVEQNSSQPQVLIYHTHTSEAYLDEDVDHFYDSYYSRTQNSDFNVVGVGDALAACLERNGIRTLHDKTVHDSSYNGSYDRSAATVRSDMEENSSIKVVLDIHRDALGTEDCKVKPTFTVNGRKAAQIMVLSGCDCNGERGFDNWENNLNFAMKIQNTAEQMYPGMTRPLDFDFFAYNEYICDGSLLIEVGTDANSIDEAEYTASLLGNVLGKVLQTG